MTPNPISIVEVSDCGTAEWDATWRACDYATYFHGPEWTSLWSRFKGEQIAARPKRIKFADGLVAIVPFAVNARGKGLLTTLTTSMEGTFGGWIASDPLEIEHALALTDYVLQGTRTNVSWRVSPYAPFASEVLERVHAQAAMLDMTAPKAQKALCCALNFARPVHTPDDTHALDLTPGFSKLFGTQSATARKAKKARKAGVEVRLAQSVEDWKQYYAVYQSSLERWGDAAGTPYAWDLFAEIERMHSPDVKLWVATAQGRIVSGALCFYAKRHVVYWHGSSLEEFFELRPVNLLMFEIIKDCCEKGYGWYDFNPSGHMQGVITFKESFGAKPLPCPLVYVDTAIKRTARATLLGLKGYL